MPRLWLTLGLCLLCSGRAYSARDEQLEVYGCAILLHEKRWSETLNAIAKLPARARKRVDVRIMEATALVGNRQFTEAVVKLEALLPEAPRRPSIYYNLALAYGQSNRPGDAKRVLQRFVKARPEDPKAQELLKQLQQLEHPPPAAPEWPKWPDRSHPNLGDPLPLPPVVG
jgi:predicted Zn-dependent protease